MEMSPQLEAKFNDQITLEFASSMVYRQLAVVMDMQDLKGAAGWLRLQAEEEIAHANRFIDHVVDRGSRVAIGAIEAPVVDGEAMIDVFRAALAHEKKVSTSIRELVVAADADSDVYSRPLLNWFLQEQIEEEATVGEIVAHLALIGDDGAGLLRTDAELARRVGAGAADPA